MSTSQSNPLLQITNLRVSYGPVEVLHGSNITIDPSSIVSLLGGNASGKSTTMKTILGLVNPTAGTIEFDGVDISDWSTARRVRAGMASVPEARRVFGGMSVLDNLLTGAFVHGRNKAVVREGLEQVYAALPKLYDRRKQLAGTMSGGEQQMLAVGRALMSRPRLICMDEPTMGLAPIVVEQVLDTIARVNSELGISVFMVEQNAELALSIADYGYVLQTGNIVTQGPARDLLNDPGVRAAYLGDQVGAT